MPSNPATDKDALIALYCATGGDNWTNSMNWLTDMALKEWTGVSAPSGPVTEIRLSRTNLIGTIPTELGNLSNLERLWFDSNELSGTIPSELGNLSNLRQLYLYLNQLTGTITTELGNLSNLERLRLENNQLTGTIPSELENLSNLQRLYLYLNQLTGSIPSELGNLSNLQRLYLSNNELSGSIPSELGNLSNLQFFDAHSNELSGTIPSELENLSSLQRLHLYTNELSGTIPSELGNLSNLRWLHLYTNELSGTIPSELGNLSNLQNLLLNSNELSGSIPSELGNLSSLQRLYLNTNELSGSIPSELGNLSRLQRLFLYTNELSGTIPSELGNLSNLQFFLLHSNELSGTIPSELGNLSNLRWLFIQENQLTGSIPSELGSLSRLQRLALSINQLTGTIPPELADLGSLQWLHLSANQLSGSIPTELSDMNRLQRLFIQDNTLLTGGTALVQEMETPPTQYGSLQEFGLWGNDDLTGAAKQATDNLGKRVDRAALWLIFVQNNNDNWKNKNGWFSTSDPFGFSGWYGVEANSNDRVSSLNLSYNDLSGNITNAFEALKDLESLDLSYNTLLTGELTLRLADLSSLTELNIRCTSITTPTDTGFQTWLGTITFIETQQDDGCSAPPPMQVTGLSVTPGIQSLSVSWSAVTDADGYKVQWKSGAQDFDSTRQHTVASGSTTTYTILTLIVGTTYTVRVIATKSNADDALAPVERTGTPKDSPPGQVSGLSVTAEIGQLSVSWDGVADADGYKVQWKSGAQDFDSTRQHTVASGSTTTYTIPTLNAGTEYTVRAIATRSHADDGQPSSVDMGTPRAPAPMQVTGLSVTAEIGQLSVLWNAVADADGYKVQWISDTENFNSPHQHTITPGSTTTYTIPTLNAGTEYTVRVIATRSHADDGQPSSADMGTPRAPAPMQVTGLSVTAEIGQLSVLWNAVANADGYKVQWISDTENFNSPHQHTITPGSTTTYTIPTLNAGTEYTVRVIATRSHADDGQPSSADMGTPRAPTPGRVMNLSVTAEIGQLSVLWNAVANANGYKVQWISDTENFNSPHQHTITPGSTTTYTIPNLNAGTEYTVRVIATRSHADDGQPSSVDMGIPRHPPPGQVTGLSVTVEVQSLSVSWNAVANADGYKVQWISDTENFNSPHQHTITPGSTTTYTIPNLNAGTTYTVRAIATRSHADDGQPSSVDMGIPRHPPPGQATVVSVTPGVLLLSVLWDVVADADGYKVQWRPGAEDFDSTRQSILTPGGVIIHRITNLNAGTEYGVRVIAVRSNAHDGQPSLEVRGIPIAPDPGQVARLSVTPGIQSLSVSWDAVVDADGYKVQWISDTENFNSPHQHTVTGSTTTYTIPNLNAGTEYTVRVIAIRSHANDARADVEVTGTPKDPPPGQVTGLSVTAEIGRLSVSWEAVVDADGYKVQWISDTENFNSPHQHTVTGSTTTYTIPNLNAGTTYTVRAIATRSHADDGPPSSEIPGTPRALAPGQVTGINVTPGIQSLSVSWEAVADADGYKVQWISGTENFNSPRQHTVTGSTTTYTIPNLNAGTEYTVRVIAIRSHADDGPPSSEIPGTPRAPAPPPPPPPPPPSPSTPLVPAPGQVTGISVTPGILQLSVSWDPVPDAAGYKVQWKSGMQDFDSTTREDTVTGGSTTSHTITDITAGTEYTVRVIAVRSNADDGQPSLEVKGIPEALDQVIPVDPPTSESGGGCAMISEKTVDNMSVRTFFNLLLILSLIFLPAGKVNSKNFPF